MSKESFGAFVARVNEDDALREELRGLATDDQGIPAEAVADFARSKGYHFTVEDATAAARSELSDEELEGVSGGSSSFSDLSFSTTFNKFQKVLPSFGFGGSLYLKLE